MGVHRQPAKVASIGVVRSGVFEPDERRLRCGSLWKHSELRPVLWQHYGWPPTHRHKIHSIGRSAGPAVFKREQSRFFNPENVERTNAFFEKHGGKAIIIARFLPIFRAFVPVAAGVGRMRYRTFVTYNLVGALLWGVGLTLVGFFLGQIDFVADYAEYFIIGIVLLSGIPILVELYKAGRANITRRRIHPADETTAVVPDRDLVI